MQTANTTSTLLFVPNVIGYARLALLVLSVFLRTREFVYLYAVSYLLDAADGYLARALGQESSLGYILDMALDRASSSVLFLRVATEIPKYAPYVSLFIILDLMSHFVSVSCGYVLKRSHKAYSADKSNTVERILSVYYTRSALFTVCLMTELFVLNLLFGKSAYLHYLSFPFFAFKQLTNILQLHKGVEMLAKAR